MLPAYDAAYRSRSRCRSGRTKPAITSCPFPVEGRQSSRRQALIPRCRFWSSCTRKPRRRAGSAMRCARWGIGSTSGGRALATRLPETLDDHAGAVIFGGPMSANDADDYVRREIDWIEVPLREQRPFLGICLGAQMLAMQLGARVAPHPEGRTEIGYYPIRPTAAGLALCPDWPEHVYHWHREGFELPAWRRTAGRGRRLPDAGVPGRPRLRLPVSSRCDLRDDALLDHARPRPAGCAGRAAAPPALRRIARCMTSTERAWLKAFLDGWLARMPLSIMSEAAE